MPNFLSFYLPFSFCLYMLFSPFRGCSHMKTSLLSVNGHDSPTYLHLFPSWCIFLSFSLSGFFASHSSSEPETSDNSLAAICEGLCKPPGLRQCCPAVKRWWDGWEYPDILQAMKGLWVLTSSSICRACTGRETWQWLQREYGDSQGRRKWALAGTFLLTFSRLCLGRSTNWHKPFLASLFCILVGDSF